MIIMLCLFLVGVFSFQRFQPAAGIAALDQLVADLPETHRFGVVKRDGRSYVVWIGRPRGAIVSGPPVYVFDDKGHLVDHVSDVGDSDNPFVNELYGAAWSGPAISAREALEFCRGK